MPDSDSPLNRSIGLSGLIRWLIAVAAVIAIGAAFAAGHYALAVAGAIFCILAVALGFRGRRA
jgi:type IV secretory pathway VirB2 component (pilin)